MKKSITLLTGAEVPSKEITLINEAKNGVVFATFSVLPEGLFTEEKQFLLGTDGFAVRTMGNVLYVVSHTPGGVFFGAHDLLEKNAEIIWTRAKRGEECSYIPCESLVLKEYDYVDKPDFISRGWNTCGDGEEGHHHDLGTMICFAKNKINTKFEIYLDMFADYEAQRFGNSTGTPTGADLSRYTDCDLLIIDDLGTELSNQFTTSCLYGLLNTRLNRHLPVILSTNLETEEFRKRYWDRITSRVLGNFTILPFKGTDIRRQKLSK